jgi:HEAT repeat protein
LTNHVISHQYPSVTAGAARRRGDIDALLDLLVGTDRNERISAAYNLGEIKATEAVGPLVRCLRAHDWVVRSSAVTALAKIGDRQAIPDILEVGAEDESIDVRVAAMTALISLGDETVADLILAALAAVAARRQDPSPGGCTSAEGDEGERPHSRQGGSF